MAPPEAGAYLSSLTSAGQSTPVHAGLPFHLDCASAAEACGRYRHIAMNIIEACLLQLGPKLREPLVTAEALDDVVARSAWLPPKLGAFYLECKLSPPSPSVDLLAGALRAAQVATVAASAPVSSPSIPHPDRISDFVQGWLDGGGPPTVRLLWTELDAAPTALPGRFGNVHVCLDPGYSSAGPRGTGPAPLARFHRQTADELLTDLHGSGVLRDLQLAVLQRCLEVLPAAGRLVHVSSMAARSPVETKAYVALPVGALGDFIADLGGEAWAERVDALEDWAKQELNGTTLYCDATFRGRACHSFGLVFSQPQLANIADDPSRAKLRQQLVQSGLCTLAQDKALGAWMLAPTDPRCDFDPQRRLLRWLDFKVTLSAAGLTSKAYLGFSAHPSA